MVLSGTVTCPISRAALIVSPRERERKRERDRERERKRERETERERERERERALKKTSFLPKKPLRLPISVPHAPL